MNELVAQIEAANDAFAQVIAAIPPERALQEHITGTWSAHKVLAHIIAWQEEGLRVLHTLLDGTYQSRKYDDDAFNAAAVAARQDETWANLVRELAETQAATVALAKSVPDDAWQNARVTGWLRGGTIDHYEEHLPALQTLVNA